jgi:hypothetical protein
LLRDVERGVGAAAADDEVFPVLKRLPEDALGALGEIAFFLRDGAPIDGLMALTRGLSQVITV